MLKIYDWGDMDVISPQFFIIMISVFLLGSLTASYVDAEEKEEPLYSEARVQVSVAVGEKGEAISQVVTPERGWVRPIERKETTSKKFSDYKVYDKVKMIVDGEEVEAIGPVLAKEKDVWLPLPEVAKRLNILLLDLGSGKFNLIRMDGTPLELEFDKRDVLVNGQLFLKIEDPILQYKGLPMANILSEDAMCQTESVWKEEGPTLTVNTIYSGEVFTTFEQPKPPEEGKKALEPPLVVIPTRMGRLLPAPPEVTSDVRVNVANTMIYEHDNWPAKKRTRTEEFNISGDIYDYRISSYLRWKDHPSGTLVNESKYFGIFGKDMWLRTLDLYYNLAPLRSQYDNYQGAELRTFSGAFSSVIFGGTKEITISGPTDTGTVKYNGQIGGISETYQSKWLDISADIIGLQNEAALQSQVARTSFPRRNLIYAADATLHLPYKIDLSGQGAFANYNPDNLKDELRQDHDLRLDVHMRREMFDVEYKYEFVGTDYASLGNPANYQDYKGWNISTRYKPVKFINLSGSYDDSQNNVDDLATQPTSSNKTINLGSNFDLPANSNLSLSWYRSKSITDGPSMEESGTISTDYRLDFFKNWEMAVLQLSYDRYGTNDIGSDNDLVANTYSVLFMKFLPFSKGSYVRVRQDFIKTKFRAFGMATTKEYLTTLGARYYFIKNFYAYGDWRVKTTAKERFSDTSFMSFRAGSEWTVCKNLILGVDYIFNDFDLYHAAAQNSRDWSILFRIVPIVQISSPMKWAKIEGYVFNDLNGNGKYDPGEPGIPNVIVKIPIENTVKTDQKGHFVIKEVIPGMKVVKMDTREVPIELAPVRGTSVVVEARALKPVRVEFPLIEYGSISGRVYVDANKNGIYDIGEEGIEEVKITLYPTPQWRESDVNGKFDFDYAFPGNYELQIDDKILPSNYELKSKEPFQINVKKGDKLSDLNIAVIERSMKVEIFKDEGIKQ